MGAEGSIPLFTNFRTGQLMTIAAMLAPIGVFVVTDPRFGAKGDGATNDSAAIQAAIDAAAAAGGGIVYVPPGTYMASQLSWPSNVYFLGVGKQISIVKLRANTNTYLLASEVWINNQTFCNLNQGAFGITFDGNKSNQSSGASPCVVSRCFRAEFSNAQVQNSKGHGLLFTTDTLAGGSTAVNGIAESYASYCDMTDNDGAGIYGEDDAGNFLADVFVNNCNIAANGQVTSHRNIHFERSAGVRIIDNQLYSNPNGNLTALLGGLTVITGNSFDNGAGDDGNTNVHVEVAGFGQLVINGNYFLDNRASAASPVTHLQLVKSSPSYISVSVTGNSFGYTNVTSPNSIHIATTSFAATDRLYLTGNSYFPETTRPTAAPLVIGNDFYEKGTFTPVLAFGGTTTGITYTTQAAIYTRIGNQVFFSIKIIITSNGSGTGAATISGLPYTASSNNDPADLIFFAGFSSGSEEFFAEVASGGTTVGLYRWDNAGTTAAALDETNILDAANIGVSGFYFV